MVAGISVETNDQIARFPDPVCPASFGFPEAFNAFVADRVRAVAGEAGIAVAPAGCRPNLLVIAAGEGRDLLAALHRRRPTYFAGLVLPEIRRLSRAAGPVRSWQVVEMRGQDGRTMENVSFVRGPDGRMMYIGAARQLSTDVASRLELPTRQDIVLSVVMFDLDAIEGLTLAHVADHAAMRALARTEPGAETPSGRTIVTLFRDVRAGFAPAEALTPFDRSYLRAVYATNNGVSGRRQRASIAGAVTRSLTDGGRERPRLARPARRSRLNKAARRGPSGSW